MCMNLNTALTGEEIDPLCPNGSTCCSANNFAGCDDSNCQAIVCSIDPDCCDINWGFDCRNTASDFCSFALGSTETAKANLRVGDDTGSEFVAICDDPNTCGNLTQCNAGDCGGEGRCFFADPSLNLDASTGICLDGNIPCEGLTDCSSNGQADCNGDAFCLHICCGPAVCFPLSTTCPSTGITSLGVESSSSSSGPTAGNAGN